MSRMVRAYCDDQWAWIDKIQPGDVLLERGDVDKPRVVRAVCRFKKGDRYGRDGLVRSVTFTTKRCSWVKRCYTILGRADLKTRKFAPSGARKQAMTTLDKMIALDITKWSHEKRLDCCNVRGIA